MRRLLLPGIAILGFMTALAPAQVAPASFSPAEVYKHRTSPTRSIRAAMDPRERLFHGAITLRVVVTVTGHVESAQAIEGPPEFRQEAEAIERARVFTPFEKEGVPVRATFADYVRIAPSEEWAAVRMPFPAVKDWKSLRITLSRSACYGRCPAYSVAVQGDGLVTFRGGSFVLITGTHHGQIAPEAVKNLLGAFRQADYFSLKDEYVDRVTDNPTYKTSITFDGQTKQVVDYVGLEAGMPDMVKQLEDSIDQLAGTGKWIEETDQTWPALVAEHWDFKAHTSENQALFANVAARGSHDLVQKFLTAGAPAEPAATGGASALENAAGKGDTSLVRQMLEANEHVPATVLFRALRAAAASGNVELARLLIARGADVNGNSGDARDHATVLIGAARSGSLEMVREILNHHPDVNAAGDGSTALTAYLRRGTEKSDPAEMIHLLLEAGANPHATPSGGQPTIFAACNSATSVKPLAQAGVDLNAKDQYGQTALMSCFTPEFLRAMIDAGADLSVRSRDGLTAAEEARRIGANDKADLLEAAMKGRPAR
jgi:ankyrin repeat protein